MFNSVIKFIFIFISFVTELSIQFFLSNKAEKGDHVDYRNYYEFIAADDFNNFLKTDSAGFIGSYDYLYNFLVFLFSRFIGFDGFTFIINIFYFALYVKVYSRLGLTIIIPFIPLSFYILGLQFSAQRLILAITVFGYYFLYSKQILSLVSLFFHVQVSPLFLLFIKKINFWFVLVMFAVFACVGYLIDITASQKLLLYALNRNSIKIQDYAFLVYIFVAIAFSSPTKDNHFLIFSFFAFSGLISLIGDGRINIIIFTYALFYLSGLSMVSKYTKFQIIVFIVYDLIKGISFATGILEGNSGFDSIDLPLNP